TAVSARLPEHVAERELSTLKQRFDWPPTSFEARPIPRSQSPGNIVLIELQSEHVTELFSCVGERGVRAEDVANQAADEALAYLDAEVPVGEHLADQLMLPLALGHGGVYRTTAPSLHTLTQVDIVRRFLPRIGISITEESANVHRVEIS